MKLENEYQLQVAVVEYIRTNHPNALLTASLGELQTTVPKRIQSYKKGYLSGSPDLKIENLHTKYSGFVIELKSPSGKGRLSDKQRNVLALYALNNFKCLVSNNYYEITQKIDDYMKDVRIKCELCNNNKQFFKNMISLNSHIKHFHNQEQ